jgi:undecaprenyl-diphosphatase
VNDLVAAAILGVVQGITEFLPVSSSGHLVLFQQWLPPVGDHVAFDLVLHLGTLLPVLFVYRSELLAIPRDVVAGEGPFLQRTGVRLLLLMFIGSVPTAIIGLVFQDVFEQLFANPVSVGVAFAVTGFVLFATRYMRQGDATEGTTRWWQALVIGIAQGVAITPGVSRSGSTIAAGLLLGFKREFAARYSFLLSIPAIGGAFLLKAKDMEPAHVAVGPLVIGFFAAAISGYLALVLLLRLVKTGDFSRFAWYLWAIAAFALFLGLR